MTAASSPVVPWTCPFCALLCDEVAWSSAPPALRGSDCPRAAAALRAHAGAAAATATVDGRAVAFDDALAEAARRLARWRLPLFGGLGTDVAGARALYRLAERRGAICDHADGAALMHGLRALQDRGQYTTTLAELRARADLVVCIGTAATPRHPEFFRRCGLREATARARRLVFLGAEADTSLPGELAVEHLPGTGDAFDDLRQLAALVGRRRVREPHPALSGLADRLLAARYAVLVWEPGRLPAAGALWAEALNRIVATLNQHTRAASLALGGDDGAATVNQVFTWLSGLPLRSRCAPGGLVHEPLLFDAARLVADGAVDGLLWISSFDAARLPPGTLPRIVLGPPAMAAKLAARDCVFLPVATPGLNAPGHLFRTDGVVLVPLAAVRDDGLRGVAEVLRALEAA